MGTDDLAERALHQGLIKLAAAYVHAVRDNPTGIAKNLAGARAPPRRPPVGGRRAPGASTWPHSSPPIDARLADPRLAAVPPVIRRIAPA